MWLRLPRNHWHCAHKSPSGAPVVTPVLLFLWPLWRAALTTAPLFPRPSSLSGSVGSGRPVFSLLSFQAQQRRWSKLSPWSPPSSTLLLLASQGCRYGFNSHHWTRRFPNPHLSFCLTRATNMCHCAWVLHPTNPKSSHFRALSSTPSISHFLSPQVNVRIFLNLDFGDSANIHDQQTVMVSNYVSDTVLGLSHTAAYWTE